MHCLHLPPALPALASTSRGPVMALFAAVLCLLVILPIGWLVVFAFTDRARNVTLANFTTLFTDPVFVEPLLTTLIIAIFSEPRLLRSRRAARTGSWPAPTCRCAAPSACWSWPRS